MQVLLNIRSTVANVAIRFALEFSYSPYVIVVICFLWLSEIYEMNDLQEVRELIRFSPKKSLAGVIVSTVVGSLRH